MDAAEVGAAMAKRLRVPHGVARAEQALWPAKNQRAHGAIGSRHAFIAFGEPAPVSAPVLSINNGSSGSDELGAPATASGKPGDEGLATLQSSTIRPATARLRLLGAESFGALHYSGGAATPPALPRSSGQPSNLLEGSMHQARPGSPSVRPATLEGRVRSDRQRAVASVVRSDATGRSSRCSGATVLPGGCLVERRSPGGSLRLPASSPESNRPPETTMATGVNHFAPSTRERTLEAFVPAKSLHAASFTAAIFAPAARLPIPHAAEHSADPRDDQFDVSAAASSGSNAVNQEGREVNRGSEGSGPAYGDVYLDGTLMGRWVMRALAAEAGLPSSGNAAFDPRRAAFPAGAMIGG